jgi:outer membrane protein TolC
MLVTYCNIENFEEKANDMRHYTFTFDLFFRCAVGAIVLALGLAGAALSQEPALSGDTLTPEQAVRTVIDRNPSIVQAKASLQASRSMTQSLSSAYYPQLDVSGSVANIYPDKALSLGGPGPGFYFAPEFPIDAHFGVSYTIFDFGKRANALDASRVAETSGVNRLENLRLSLCYQVLQLFHTAILQGKSIGVKDEEIADRNSHVAVVRRRIETGSATEFDALRAEELLAAAKSERIDLLNRLARLQAQLHELLGFPQEKNIVFAEAATSDRHLLNGDSLIACALQQRSDYAAAKTAALAARFQVQKAKLENMPTLGAEATVGFKNGVLTSLYSIDTVQFNWVVGLALTVPIFDGNRAKYHKAAAEANVDAANAGISDLAQRIRIEVLQAKSDVEAAFAKLDLDQVQVQLAEKALRMAHIKYDAGVITNVDVLDAERDCSVARLSYVSGQYQYVLNCLALDMVTGAIYAGMK